MNQDKPKQRVKTLSIRIPEVLYLTVSQYAIDNDLPSMNAAIISLITNGLEVMGDKDSAITQFILELIPQHKLEEIINGKTEQA